MYFLTERQRNAKASEEKAKASAEKHSSRAAERAAEFVPPKVCAATITTDIRKPPQMYFLVLMN